MAIPTPDQHNKFRKLVEKTADELIGQSREDVVAKIEKIDKDGTLEAQVGSLRFGFRKAVLQELEKKTNVLRK